LDSEGTPANKRLLFDKLLKFAAPTAEQRKTQDTPVPEAVDSLIIRLFRKVKFAVLAVRFEV
jgi:hypothetical protein